MIYVYGNMFASRTWRRPSDDSYLGDTFIDAICITTNGFVKRNGEAVMGRGCAYEAARRHPDLPKRFGQRIKTHGNQVALFATENRPHIVSFPVKASAEICEENGRNVVRHMRHNFSLGDPVPGWACKARLCIIENSARELKELADDLNWYGVLIPRPGCGAGELMWRDVRPILQQYLGDSRFYIVSHRQGDFDE